LLPRTIGRQIQMVMAMERTLCLLEEDEPSDAHLLVSVMMHDGIKLRLTGFKDANNTAVTVLNIIEIYNDSSLLDLTFLIFSIDSPDKILGKKFMPSLKDYRFYLIIVRRLPLK
jgi:hypothetical protein